jgi:FtsH-binding integral membrane protein
VVFFLAIYLIFFNFFVLSNVQLRNQHYYLIISISTIVEFAALSLLFYNIIESPVFKKIIFAVAFLAGGFLIYSIFTTLHETFDSVPSAITSLIFLVYSIYYLFERMKDSNPLNLFSSPVFWVVVGIIIYSAGTFFPFIYAKNYMKEDDFVDVYDLIHDPLYIIKNLIFSFAMLQKDKPVKALYPVYKKTKTKP